MKWSETILKNLIIKLLRLFKLYSAAKTLIHLIDHYNLKKIHKRKEARQFYSQFIRKGDLYFDVGANIGNRTELFRKLGARVVCIEPQQICLQHLHKLFAADKDVIIVAKAIADKEGYAELAICEEAPTISTMSTKWKNESRFSKNYTWTKTQKVPTTTLDTLIRQYGLPVFCKIDVEGFEESVLKGLTKPIPIISFEFTRELFHETKQCINHLLTIGSVEFNCASGETMKLLFPTWVLQDELYAKLDSMEEIFDWGDIYARFI
jgi:FkbM family methyltransferase